MRFILNWLVTSIAIAVATALVPGIEPLGGGQAWISFAFVGLFLGLVNAAIKPIVSFISLPFTILTLGIFQLVVNAFMLELASSLSLGVFGAGIAINGLGTAVIGALVISILSGILNGIVDNA